MGQTLPIEYTAVLRDVSGHESAIDLEDKQWLQRPELRSAMAFSLNPKPGAALSPLCVHFAEKKLVYFSRVFGRVGMNAQQLVSIDEQQILLFRTYTVGWEDEHGTQMLLWVYPGGSVLATTFKPSDEFPKSPDPPFIDELIEHYWAMHLVGRLLDGKILPEAEAL